MAARFGFVAADGSTVAPGVRRPLAGPVDRDPLAIFVVVSVVVVVVAVVVLVVRFDGSLRRCSGRVERVNQYGHLTVSRECMQSA